MVEIKKLNPIYYFRGGVWIKTVVPLIKSNANIRAVLSEMGGRYLENMEACLEPDLSAEDLADEMALLAHEFSVRCKQFHYLRDHIGAFDLVDLYIAIGSELFPQKDWQVLENDEYAIVIDADRTMVLDIVYCEDMSALGAMALCGDSEALQNPRAVEEVAQFHQARYEKNLRAIDRMKQDLARFSKEGQILEFEPPR